MNSPYARSLVNLLTNISSEDRASLASLPSVSLTDRALNDLELLATGGFSPVDRFMGARDYARVLAEMRLADGTLWPMPITLRIPEELSSSASPRLRASGLIGTRVTLRDSHNEILAVMQVEEVFNADPMAEAAAVLGTTDSAHPLVAEMRSWPSHCVSGPIQVLRLPRHYDFADLRRTPAQVHEALSRLSPGPVVAFQTRNPIHRSHEELTKRAMDACKGLLLLHPVVGLTKPGDIDHFTRVRSYRALVDAHYDPRRTLLSLLPLAMRMAGPREALWHAIIRRNFGATHFIVGRHHAAPGNDSRGKPFYGPYDAQALCQKHATEIGMTIMPFEELVYLPDEDRYEETSRVPAGARVLTISGTQVRDEYLGKGRPLPAWFSRPEVANVLAKAGSRDGFCVWFTGLSGAGKTMTAEAVLAGLLERGRAVTMLDGDVVRTHLSKGLGFSKEDRDTNIRRIGFVASEIVRHGGVAVCAAISPYRAVRDECRALVGASRFVEVFVDTPLEVCERRDTKGLYAKARLGEVKGVTGIDDPYEPPVSPEIRIDTTSADTGELAASILRLLETRGWMTSG